MNSILRTLHDLWLRVRGPLEGVLSDVVVRGIRTFVPLAVGWLYSEWDLPWLSVDPELVAATAAAAWWTLASAIESRVPWLGWLLGVPKHLTNPKTTPSRFH